MRKVTCLIIAFIALGCIESKKNLPKEFDFGKIENGVYANSFFEMEIPFNLDWVVQDKQQLNDLIEVGNELVTGNDKNLKAMVKASKVNTAYLFTIFKHDVGSVVEFNPSFMAVAENTNSFPEIKTGEDYLFHLKKLLEQSQMAYYFEKEILEQSIGKLNFHRMEAKLEHLDKIVIQEYMSTVIKGFSLSFIVSYTTDDERTELYDIIDNIKV